MKKVISGLFISASFTAGSLTSYAAILSNSDNSAMALMDMSKGKVVGITERGPHAVDAAHLLAIQHLLHPAYQPEFIAADTAELNNVEAKYHLISSDLPAFIFLNKQGVEIGRIEGGHLTTVGRYVANNSAIVDN